MGKAQVNSFSFFQHKKHRQIILYLHHNAVNLHHNHINISPNYPNNMAQTSMTVRLDNKQKAIFDELCAQFGMSANTAINIFVKAVIRSKSIPFPIQAKNEEDEVTAKAKAAFQYMCDTARENNIDMSLDEINEEIREVRRLRKERNNGICGD